MEEYDYLVRVLQITNNNICINKVYLKTFTKQFYYIEINLESNDFQQLYKIFSYNIYIN